MSETFVSFWRTVAENCKQVKKWPKWKQRIIINSEAASTGKFMEDK